MKRILALVLCFAMMLSVIPANAAEDFTVSQKVEFEGSSPSLSEKITVKGTYKGEVILRVFNNAEKLIYMDTATGDKSGNFKFEEFKLEAPDLTGVSGKAPYDITYKFVYTDGKTGAILKSEPVTFEYGSSSSNIHIPGPDPSPTPDPPKPVDPGPWVVLPDQPNGPDDPVNPYDIPAHVDPRDNTQLWASVDAAASPSAAAAIINAVTVATPVAWMADETARNNVATASEVMAANIGAKTMNVSNNSLMLNASAISASDLNKLATTMEAIEKAIKKNEITLNREMVRELVLNVRFNNKSKATITISKDLVAKLEGANVDLLTIKDTDFKISYTTKELKDMLGSLDEFSFEIDKSGFTGSTKKLEVNFKTDSTQSVKISFPNLSGETKYMAIVDEQGNPVGGRYNPSTGAIEAKISESGVYTVVNNEKDFADIKNLSEEMQESIKILSAKGVIDGTSPTEFSPEKTITRAEVAALLLRVLAQIDPNADGGFIDVKPTDWFYGTAGSSKAYGMILGYSDNTFRGNTVIPKDQILTIASRILQREMRYKIPQDTSEWLTFADSDSIANWARNDIALATMANIITRTKDNTISANSEMTRGDAALIIMRLFYKIW